MINIDDLTKNYILSFLSIYSFFSHKTSNFKEIFKGLGKNNFKNDFYVLKLICKINLRSQYLSSKRGLSCKTLWRRSHGRIHDGLSIKSWFQLFTRKVKNYFLYFLRHAVV